MLNNFSSLCVSPGTIWDTSLEGPNYGASQVNDSVLVCAPPSVYNVSLGGNTIYKNHIGTWFDADSDEELCSLANFTWARVGSSDKKYGYSSSVILGEYYSQVEVNTSTNSGSLKGSGNSILGTSSQTSLITSQVNYSECCGDDYNEKLTVGTCDGSFLETPLCCPNDGNDYKVLDGYCILEDYCPDVERAPPVFTEINNVTLLATWDGSLRSSGDGYCCNASPNITADPLCDLVNFASTGAGNKLGCFLTNSSLFHEVSPESARVQWCREVPTDPYCVINSTASDVLSICSQSTLCSETMKSNTRNPDYVVNCSDPSGKVISVSQENMTYEVLPSSCSSLNVSGCVSRTVIDYAEPSFSNGGSLYCDINGGDISTKTSVFDYSSLNASNCYLVYNSSQVSSSFEVYDNPSCVFDAGCEPNVLKTIYAKPIISFPGSISSLSCSLLSSQVNTTNADGVVENVSFKTKEGFSCDYTPSCVNLSTGEDTFCIPRYNSQGEDIIVSLNHTVINSGSSSIEKVQCAADIKNIFSFGDNWCPAGENFAYDNVTSSCFKATAVCDQGFAGNLQYGCDSLTSNADDFFGLYNSHCVVDGINNGVTVYDSACCYQTSIGSYQLYQNDKAYLSYAPIIVY